MSRRCAMIDAAFHAPHSSPISWRSGRTSAHVAGHRSKASPGNERSWNSSRATGRAPIAASSSDNEPVHSLTRSRGLRRCSQASDSNRTRSSDTRRSRADSIARSRRTASTLSCSSCDDTTRSNDVRNHSRAADSMPRSRRSEYWFISLHRKGGSPMIAVPRLDCSIRTRRAVPSRGRAELETLPKQFLPTLTVPLQLIEETPWRVEISPGCWFRLHSSCS